MIARFKIASVQKIQQNTILKNGGVRWQKEECVQKIQQNTILKNYTAEFFLSLLFKKYNKIQSLRTRLASMNYICGSKNTTKYNP